MADIDKNRKARREALREELKSREYIRQIHLIVEGNGWDDPSKVNALKAKADIYFKLLAKTLPDAKHVEHSGLDGEPIETKIIIERTFIGED